MTKQEEVIKMNEWLKSRNKYVFKEVRKFPSYLVNKYVYYIISSTKIQFRCWEDDKYSAKVFKLTEDVSKNPKAAFSAMQKVYKQPQLYKMYLDKDKKIRNPYQLDESVNFKSYWNPILTYFDSSKAMEKVKVWYYDINAAYGSILSGPIPDFKKPHRRRPEDDLFFVAFNSKGWVVNNDSEEAILWFPLMESPYIEAVLRWRKKKSLKYIYTMGTGYMAYEKTQPCMLLFNYVVYRLSQKIAHAVKGKDVIRIWVDGIYALEPLDVKVSKEIGDWSHDYVGLAQFRNVSHFRTEEKEVPIVRLPSYEFDINKKEIISYGSNYDQNPSQAGYEVLRQTLE